jgi:hypothetical protein
MASLALENALEDSIRADEIWPRSEAYHQAIRLATERLRKEDGLQISIDEGDEHLETEVPGITMTIVW